MKSLRKRREMFEKLIWQKDRMILDKLVFRLQHVEDDTWELGDDCFSFYKTQRLVDQYAEFFSSREFCPPKNVLELGVWDGGSVAFWFECFDPQKHVGIDNQQKQDSQYFKRYVSSQGLEQRIKIYWGTDQGDTARLQEIVKNDFSGPLDLVIDDASHMYGLTKKSFEILFPYLRPGGLYIIEDWAWGHWNEFQAPDHPWAKEVALTKLIFELTEATGSSISPIADLTIFRSFTVIRRSQIEITDPTKFELESFILRRPNV
jgi:predicted O-methyltransferase YrrM